MKKFILLGILCCFLLTGCGNSGTKTCTKTDVDEDGYKSTDTVVVKYKNNKITKVEETNISEMDSESIDFTVSFGQTLAKSLNEIDGYDLTYEKEGSNKVKTTMVIDYTKLDVDKLKEAIGEYEDENTFYTSKDTTIDEFIEKELDGYTCK